MQFCANNCTKTYDNIDIFFRYNNFKKIPEKCKHNITKFKSFIIKTLCKNFQKFHDIFIKYKN